MDKGIIIYVGAFELPDRNAAAHRVMSNGKILRDLGYTVIFLGARKSMDDRAEYICREQDHFGFECWSVSYPDSIKSWASYVLGQKAISAFITMKRSARVVAAIFYNYPAVAQLRYSSDGKRFDIKHLADATEWYDSSGGSVLFKFVKWIDTSLRMRFAHLRADGLLTTSKYLTSRYDRRKKVTVELPTLFDTETISPPPESSCEKGRQFIYVGTPFDVKRVNRNRSNLKERLDTNILCFSKLFDRGIRFGFSVYGITEDDYLSVFPEHRGHIEKMRACVRFFGRQSNDVVVRAVACSDVSVFFRSEARVTLAGFPSKFAESVSCGTPVISSRMPNLEAFADLAFVFLAEPGQEYEAIYEMAAMSDKEINTLKEQSYKSRTFDYRKFTPRVDRFLGRLGI